MKFRRKLRALALLALSASWRSRSFAFGPAAPPTPDANAETAEGTETAPGPTGPLLLGREQWQFHQWRAETDAGSGGFGTFSELFCFDIFEKGDRIWNYLLLLASYKHFV